jgi:hypothetical protein
MTETTPPRNPTLQANELRELLEADEILWPAIFNAIAAGEIPQEVAQ